MPEHIKRTKVASAVFFPISVTIPSGEDRTAWFPSPAGKTIALDIPPLDGVGAVAVQIQIKQKGAEDDTADYVRIDSAGTMLSLAASLTEWRKYGSPALEALKGFTGGHYHWRLVTGAEQNSDKIISIPHRD